MNLKNKKTILILLAVSISVGVLIFGIYKLLQNKKEVVSYFHTQHCSQFSGYIHRESVWGQSRSYENCREEKLCEVMEEYSQSYYSQDRKFECIPRRRTGEKTKEMYKKLQYDFTDPYDELSLFMKWIFEGQPLPRKVERSFRSEESDSNQNQQENSETTEQTNIEKIEKEVAVPDFILNALSKKDIACIDRVPTAGQKDGSYIVNAYKDIICNRNGHECKDVYATLEVDTDNLDTEGVTNGRFFVRAYHDGKLLDEYPVAEYHQPFRGDGGNPNYTEETHPDNFYFSIDAPIACNFYMQPQLTYEKLDEKFREEDVYVLHIRHTEFDEEKQFRVRNIMFSDLEYRKFSIGTLQ